MIDTTTSAALLIAERGTKVRRTAGQSLFREGDPSTSVYVCLSGRIKIFVTTPTGREMTLGIKSSGQMFGELSALDARPRSASAAAMERSVVAQLSADEFLQHLSTAPGLAVSVLRELSDHLRRANLRVLARDTENITVRTGNLLVELGEKMRRHSPGDDVMLPISQDEVASWIGATREATARSLAVFRRAGAISTGRQRIVLHGLDAVVAVTLANA